MGFFLALLWRPIWSTKVFPTLPNAWCFYNGKSICNNRKIKTLLELTSSSWCLLGPVKSRLGGWRCECYPQTLPELGQIAGVGFSNCSDLLQALQKTWPYVTLSLYPNPWNTVLLPRESGYEDTSINTCKAAQAWFEKVFKWLTKSHWFQQQLDVYRSGLPLL